MRIRKPSNKGGVKKVISKFPSFRMNRIVWAEGPLELDYIYLLEHDHANVLSFQEQPCRIHYQLDGKKHQYTPDFYVEKSDKRLIVEVKMSDDADTEENRRLFRIASDICHENGYEFIVVTDVTIREQPRLNNIKVLTKYERTPLDDPAYQITCHEFFTGRTEAHLGELTGFFESRNIGKEVVYGLLYWGIIGFDLMQPIGIDSTVRLPSEAANERKVS